jgi:hypothetical protein
MYTATPKGGVKLSRHIEVDIAKGKITLHVSHGTRNTQKTSYRRWNKFAEGTH